MASPVTIQPSLADTYIRQDTPTTNYGGASLGIQADTYRAILKFDFSAVVPAGATITLATLSLYCTYWNAAATITVYRLLRTNWVEMEATWNKYKTSLGSWGTAGALGSGVDFTPTDAATAATVTGWLNVTVTAQVQTALVSVGRVAHFLAAGANADQYASREYADTAVRPKLYIEYTLPVLLPKVNIGGIWKSPVSMSVNIGGTWKTVVSVKVNIGGTWKDLA